MTVRWIAGDVIARHAALAPLVARLTAAIGEGELARMHVPARASVALDGAAFVSMPAVAPGLGVYVHKVATILPRAADDPRPAVSALVTAFSTRTGEPLAILDGNAITALKCAAVSALVIDRCARRDARVLVIAGAGVQAWQQARAACAVRPIRAIRVWARRADRARAFADRLRAELDLAVTVGDDLDALLAGAELVATATAAHTPIARFTDLAADVHINCMGGHTPSSREIPHDVLRAARLIVEHVPTAIAEAGDLHAGACSLAALGVSDADELRARRTIFSSTGHAALDVITTVHLLHALGALPA